MCRLEEVAVEKTRSLFFFLFSFLFNSLQLSSISSFCQTRALFPIPRFLTRTHARALPARARGTGSFQRATNSEAGLLIKAKKEGAFQNSSSSNFSLSRHRILQLFSAFLFLASAPDSLLSMKST